MSRGKCAAGAAALPLRCRMGGAAMAVAQRTGRRQKVEQCAACHGHAGNSTIPAIPSLAGQPAQFIAMQLYMFREGNRKDPQMTPVAATLSNADMNDLGDYFSQGKPVLPARNDPPNKTGRRGASPSNTIARRAMARRS